MARLIIHNHLPAQDANRFQSSAFGGAGAYKCEACGKTTRESGLGESGMMLCKSCLSKGYIENAKSDYGPKSPEYKAALKEYGPNVKK
jgi:hypothetical protein